MNNKRTFQLIKGTFTPSEANHVLGALVTSKVNYHNMQKHSHKETTGDGHIPSEERLLALKEMRENLDEIFKQAAESNQNLCVNGWIEVTPME